MDRYQEIAAIDLIKRINSMLDFSFGLSQKLQEPVVKGQISADGISVDSLEYNNIIKQGHVLQDLADAILTILSKKAYTDVVTPGLIHYKVDINDFLDDSAQVKTVGLYVVDEVSVDDKMWEAIGIQMESYSMKFEKPTPVGSKSLGNITVCHNLIDAMMYELQGKKPETGESHSMELPKLKTLLESRCRVLGRRLGMKSEYESDYTIIESLQNTIKAQTPLLSTNQDCLDLASTIEGSIPRMVCFLFGWSILNG